MVLINKLRLYLKMLMFSHTLSSLPFALIAMLVAANGLPSIDKIIWIVLALIGARNGANGQNRIIDRKIDFENERTKNREIPIKKVSVKEATFVVIFFYILFIFSAYKINLLCLLLSPIAIILFTIYSYTKRFTLLCHYILGFICAGAVIGADIAINNSFSFYPFILAAAVMFFISGFDIIYATLDIEHDNKVGLKSIPAKLGFQNALKVSSVSHLLMVILLVIYGYFVSLGYMYFIGVGVISLMLIIEHLLVTPGNNKRMKLVSYTINQYISVILLLFVIIDIFIVRSL